MMKHIAIGMVFSWMAMLACGATTADESPNLVKNPGLEDSADRNNVPLYWSGVKPSDYPADWGVGGGNASVGRCPLARSGRYSIVYAVRPPVFPVVTSDDWWDYTAWQKVNSFFSDHWSVAFKTDDFPVEEYHLYRLQGYVKAENVLKLHVKFISTFVYPGQKDPVVRWTDPLLHDPMHTVLKSGTWDWEKWETVVPVPEYVERARIEFWVDEWAAPASLYCDDMAVTDAGPYPFFVRNRKR